MCEMGVMGFTFGDSHIQELMVCMEKSEKADGIDHTIAEIVNKKLIEDRFYGYRHNDRIVNYSRKISETHFE